VSLHTRLDLGGCFCLPSCTVLLTEHKISPQVSDFAHPWTIRANPALRLPKTVSLEVYFLKAV